MKKKITILLVLVVVLVVVGIFLRQKGYFQLFENTTTVNKVTQKDYKNIAYTVEGTSVLLTNGVSQISAAPNSASKITTQYFGNEVLGVEAVERLV